MPIRMVDDPQDPQDNSGEEQGGGSGFSGGGGGGGILQLLLLLLGIFRGRGLIFLLVILGAGYFFLGRGGCNGAGGSLLQKAAQLATGGYLDPRQFEKANIYESLADDSTKNPLPEAVNLQ